VNSMPGGVGRGADIFISTAGRCQDNTSVYTGTAPFLILFDSVFMKSPSICLYTVMRVKLNKP
jgi:hypothetical protein